MSIFERKITWTSWKFGVLKLAMMAFGILLGAHFHEFWQSWTVALWVVFGVCSAICMRWGLRDLFEEQPHERAVGSGVR